MDICITYAAAEVSHLLRQVVQHAFAARDEYLSKCDPNRLQSVQTQQVLQVDSSEFKSGRVDQKWTRWPKADALTKCDNCDNCDN